MISPALVGPLASPWVSSLGLAFMLAVGLLATARDDRRG